MHPKLLNAYNILINRGSGQYHRKLSARQPGISVTCGFCTSKPSTRNGNLNPPQPASQNRAKPNALNQLIISQAKVGLQAKPPDPPSLSLSAQFRSGNGASPESRLLNLLMFDTEAESRIQRYIPCVYLQRHVHRSSKCMYTDRCISVVVMYECMHVRM